MHDLAGRVVDSVSRSKDIASAFMPLVDHTKEDCAKHQQHIDSIALLVARAKYSALFHDKADNNTTQKPGHSIHLIFLNDQIQTQSRFVLQVLGISKYTSQGWQHFQFYSDS